ncbi:hypothetical protein H8K35_12270 [Undibacterium sp. LX40W]|uniref:Uncharacterized protein n=1 Tax=Undibacterium nitidum TaxID=2762298 RepID=A0A923HXR5_9BURK|nr:MULTISPECIES: hypothetical protein [Undibacterium]MBC3882161.1 hypothetical protein [Undibacterium nitidum]MBC3892442.1 hypothetical protein [Undibacterium sp. LX40W]
MSLPPVQSTPCHFCAQRTASIEKPSLETTQAIFYEPHEGAYWARCKVCDTEYVVYWLEYRDDMFTYFCPVTFFDRGPLKAPMRASVLTSAEVRSFIVEHEVFVVSPWQSKWERGVFLPSPMPR